MRKRRWRRLPRPSDYCYVAVKPDCGCLVAAVAIGLTARFQLQRQVGTWLVRGWLVGHVQLREAELRLRDCYCEAPAPDPRQLAFA